MADKTINSDSVLLIEDEKGKKNRPFLKIGASRKWTSLNLRELWEHRELLYFFTWRDIKVRYKQTLLGASWAVIQPFGMMIVFSLFFGRLAKIPSDGIPYPIFSYSALVPWAFFANGMNLASNSLVSHSSLIKKIYFPRLVMPISSILVGFVDFVIAFFFLIVMMFYFGFIPTLKIFYLPLFLLLAFVSSLGVSLWLSPMNVVYRDIRHAIPFLTQFWLFATPIAYPSSLLSEPWRSVYALNPMVGVVEGFRWALLGTDTAPGSIIIVSSLMACAVLFFGAVYFRHMEKVFSDII